jgi:hypothetical protein
MTTNYIALRSNKDLVRFRNYVLSFYAYDGLYPVEGLSVSIVERAIMQYLEICSSVTQHETWGQGDSLDRERVRDLIIDNSIINLKVKESFQ